MLGVPQGRSRKIEGRPGGRSGLTYPGGVIKEASLWRPRDVKVFEFILAIDLTMGKRSVNRSVTQTYTNTHAAMRSAPRWAYIQSASAMRWWGDAEETPLYVSSTC